MITIRNTEVKNTLKELTVRDFEICSKYIEDKETVPSEKWLNILEYLGLPEKELGEVTIDEVIEFAQNFCQTDQLDTILRDVYLVGGKEYYLKGGNNWVMSAKDLLNIEKGIKKRGGLDISETLAIILKEKGVSAEASSDEAYLVTKKLLISETPVDLFFPLLIRIGIYISDKLILVARANQPVA